MAHRGERHTWSIHSQRYQVYPYRKLGGGYGHEETRDDRVSHRDGIHPVITL